MAIAFGAALGESHIASGSLTTTASAPAGSFIVFNVNWYGTMALSSVTGGGLTWTVDKEQSAAPDTNFRSAVVSAQAPSGLASGSVISSGLTAVSIMGLSAYYVTGVATSSALDATGGATASSGTSATCNVTTSNADDVVTYSLWADALTTDVTPAASFNEVYDVNNTIESNRWEVGYRIVSSTSTYTPGGSWSGSRTWVMAAAAYKAAAGGGGAVGEASTPVVAIAGPGAVGDMAFQWLQIVGVDPSTGVAPIIQGLDGTITVGAGVLTRADAQVKTGTVTSSGALARADTRGPFAGTVTSTGAVAKLDAKPLTATVSPAGVLTSTKVIIRLLTGTVSPVGNLIRDAVKRTVGTITPVGTIVRSTGKAAAGLVTPAAAIVKAVGKLAAGTVTAGPGTLALLRVLLRTLTATVTAVGNPAKQAQKATGALATPAGVIRVKAVSKTSTGTVAASGGIARAVSKRVAGAITAVGALVTGRVFVKLLAGAIAAVGAVTSFKSSGLPDVNPITATVRAGRRTGTVQSAATHATARARGAGTTAGVDTGATVRARGAGTTARENL